jgi:hypothetical protein
MNDNIDVKFLRINSPGFENAEADLLELGWKEKRFTRAIDKDIKRAYFVYLVKEKAAELKRGLTRDEVAELEKAALELKNTKMYTKSRGASAVSMNNSEEYAEEEVFIPENERLEMAKKILKAERPKPVVRPRPANSAARLNEVWASIRRPPKASFPNASLNLPNNSRDYEGNAIPLNNILRNFNKLNIGNRNTLKRKRDNSLSLSNRRKSRKRSKSMNAHRALRRTRFIRRDRRRGSKFSNLPSATRKKYIRRRFSRK